jgi:glycosyltransferase involved in cell wall biosynthesis
MKVLWFSNTPALGSEIINQGNKIKGTGGWLYSLNIALQSHINLSIVFHYPYKLDAFEYQDTKFYPIYTGNIIFENLRARFFGKIYDKDFLSEYLKIIDEVNPDIIHIHGTENPFLCIIDKINLPVVVSIQGNLIVYQHKFFSGFHGRHIRLKKDEINIKTLLFGRENFRRGYIKMKKMSILEKKYLKHTKHIIGRTDWDRRITRILAPQSKYYIGNEMLRDSFYENEWSNKLPNSQLVLFTTNGNSYYKGFETLCCALHLLNNLGIDVEWRVAGISNNSLINTISKKELGISYPQKGLTLMGSLAENELILNMQESNIYIMTSHIENSPNNLCEAMILGMPCIATFAGGTSSLLTDREEGILVQDGDPWAMAGAIIELYNDPEKAMRYGKKAREIALKRHDRELITSQYLEIYKDIISNHINEN